MNKLLETSTGISRITINKAGMGQSRCCVLSEPLCSPGPTTELLVRSPPSSPGSSFTACRWNVSRTDLSWLVQSHASLRLALPPAQVRAASLSTADAAWGWPGLRRHCLQQCCAVSHLL